MFLRCSRLEAVQSSHGLRGEEVTDVVLYDAPGNLPEPAPTHLPPSTVVLGRADVSGILTVTVHLIRRARAASTVCLLAPRGILLCEACLSVQFAVDPRTHSTAGAHDSFLSMVLDSDAQFQSGRHSQ